MKTWKNSFAVSLLAPMLALAIVGCGRANTDSGVGVAPNGGGGTNPLPSQEFANYCSGYNRQLYTVGNDLFCLITTDYGSYYQFFGGGNAAVPQFQQVGGAIVYYGPVLTLPPLNALERLVTTARVRWDSGGNCNLNNHQTNLWMNYSSSLFDLGGNNQQTTTQISTTGTYRIGLPYIADMTCAEITISQLKVQRCENQSKQIVACP